MLAKTASDETKKNDSTINNFTLALLNVHTIERKKRSEKKKWKEKKQSLFGFFRSWQHRTMGENQLESDIEIASCQIDGRRQLKGPSQLEFAIIAQHQNNSSFYSLAFFFPITFYILSASYIRLDWKHVQIECYISTTTVIVYRLNLLNQKNNRNLKANN